MKTPHLKHYQLCLLLLAFSFLLFSGMKCKKEATGFDALPTATQEGKETFGCLVNGEVFTPKGSNLGGPTLSSFYQYLNRPNGNGYFFNVSASNKQSELIKGISINTENIILVLGNNYVLKKNESFATYSILTLDKANIFSSSDLFKGELFISKFDDINQIVSGTFWFDAVNDKGEKVEVREGRFDVRFVK